MAPNIATRPFADPCKKDQTVLTLCLLTKEKNGGTAPLRLHFSDRFIWNSARTTLFFFSPFNRDQKPAETLFAPSDAGRDAFHALRKRTTELLRQSRVWEQEYRQYPTIPDKTGTSFYYKRSQWDQKVSKNLS